MATTTNYSWTTPDDTALVKDGAAAIRSLGTAIDTTVFNNASAAIAKTIVDAKGDIIAATAADTVARLAVGANDTVLTADSSTATGLKWAAPSAGSLTLLSTTTLSGASTTISSINQTYSHLQIFIYGVTNDTSSDNFHIKPNNAENVDYVQSAYATTDNAYTIGGNNQALFLSNYNNKPGRTSSDNAWIVNIYNYASTTIQKALTYAGSYYTANGYMMNLHGAGKIDTTSAISSLVFTNTGGNLSAGTVLIYGVK